MVVMVEAQDQLLGRVDLRPEGLKPILTYLFSALLSLLIRQTIVVSQSKVKNLRL